jgi:hypothetical protein
MLVVKSSFGKVPKSNVNLANVFKYKLHPYNKSKFQINPMFWFENDLSFVNKINTPKQHHE